MGNLRRRVERLGGGSGKERRAYCKAWAEFLTENEEPATAEEMDSIIPPGVTCYEEWLHDLKLEEGSRHEPGKSRGT